MPGRNFAHMQNYVNLHILHMFEGRFLLDATQIILCFGAKGPI